jgi:hypothetical protein
VFIHVIHRAPILALQRWWFKRAEITLISISTACTFRERKGRKAMRSRETPSYLAAIKTASYPKKSFGMSVSPRL